MNEIKPQNRNEVLLKNDGEWLHFRNPHRLIVAERLEQVFPALREIERLIESHGWYAAGFLSYEAAPAFDRSFQTHPAGGFPYLWFGLYPEPNLARLPRPEAAPGILSWSPDVDRATYNTAIAKIRASIAEGKTYQVNYTMRLRAGFNQSPWDFFLHLAQNQNRHAAYLDLGRYAICSASPELFFQLDGDLITCRPMKGTTRRGRTTAEDQRQAEWLRNSEKNRAENEVPGDFVLHQEDRPVVGVDGAEDVRFVEDLVDAESSEC